MIDGRTVLGIVAARGGSKGLPGKNILPVAGRPLIQWTIDAARESRYIDRLILSSDDEDIIEVARRGGCDVPFRRDAALATDEASSIDVLADALGRVTGYQIAVLLQPTSPLRTGADIDGALECMQSHAAPACVAVRPAEEHPYWTYRVAGDGRMSPYALPPEAVPQRRQELPAAWCVNGAVYAFDVAWFLEQLKLVTPQTVAYAMPAERSIDIDTVADVHRMQAAIAARAAGHG